MMANKQYGEVKGFSLDTEHNADGTPIVAPKAQHLPRCRNFDRCGQENEYQIDGYQCWQCRKGDEPESAPKPNPRGCGAP